MRIFKTILLGILFSFAGLIMLLVISFMRGGVGIGVGVEPAHATGLSAVVAGIIEALISPMTLLVIVIAFVAAIWVTRKTTKSIPT